MSLEEPEATYLVDAYTINYPRTGICFDLDRFVESGRDGLSAELCIRSSDPLCGGVLERQRLNLLAGSTKVSLAKKLASRVPDVDWDGALIDVCELALRKWRDGEPIIDLEDVGARTTPKYLVPGYLELGTPNVFYADGGSAKSFIALALALSVSTGRPLLGHRPTQTGPSLYLDWEADKWEHTERLYAIKTGMEYHNTLPYPIYYRREIASLGETVQTLRRKIASLDLKLLIIDSMGHARGGEVKDDQKTRDLFAAARSLNVTTLIVDHVSKDGRDGAGGPIGSVYTRNDARNAWFLEKAQEESGDVLVVSLSHKKANNGRTGPKRALQLHFERDGDGALVILKFVPIDPMTVPEFAKKESIWRQIVAILENHSQVHRADPGMTVKEITEEINALGGQERTTGTIKTLLGDKRYVDKFVRLASRIGQETYWGLRTMRQEEGVQCNGV